MPAPLSLSRQVEELTLIRCSLLPGEHLTFLDFSSDLRLGTFTSRNSAEHTSDTSEAETDVDKWERLISADSILDDDQLNDLLMLSPAKFRLAVDGAKVAFEVDCQGYDGECRSVNECIAISGDNLSRAMQEWWRERIKEGLDGVENEDGGGAPEYPLYQLLSLYLLPLLHQSIDDEIEEAASQHSQSAQPQKSQPSQEIYHVLFTSHHLVSSTKRRNLQSWSSDLKIVGFAKIGYPGVIYSQGSKDDIEEFVGNVKAMQWKALKVRFVEPLEDPSEPGASGGVNLRGWNEFEKVGQVVEEMRRLGRGKYVTEMGIGGGSD
ncbi:hypothetical protein D9756_006243 [Leucocoprinus leucothites]|uniref:Uncharacterized protein n=1 Tax=Leucocoprinus leucothites TaxID=201217 RepID=A0A8H5FXG6_9AGAR|nr:hypothetical protein D9756_006243 [Leucoagaricus leucothites]